jgi:hypothetical protein
METIKERLVPVAKPVRELNESELRHAFGNVQLDSPIWLAVTQMLLEEYQAHIDETGHRETAKDYGTLAAAAGGMEALGQFYAKLIDRFADAHKVAPRRE